MKTLKDQIGVEHSFNSAPTRIISLVPSHTELLCDLGLENAIVGITKFCVHPYHLRSTKKVVGGTKQVNYDEISSLKPDVIICNKEENSFEMIETLKHIAPVWVTDVITIEDNFQLITDFGLLFNKRTDAQKWNDKIKHALENFKFKINQDKALKVAYFIWKNPYMVAASNTYIDSLLQLNGFVNCYANKNRYPEIELKKLRIDGDPDLVFLSSEPFPFKEEDAFAIGRFTHHAKTVFVDGEMFAWNGSRLLKSIHYFSILQDRIKS